MSVVHRILHISNLPVGISNEAILHEMKRVFNLEGFRNADKIGVRVLPVSGAPSSAGAGQQWAIIYNANLTGRELELLKMHKFCLEHLGNKRSIVVHADTLMEYGPEWQSQVTMSPREIRSLNSQLFGQHHRKIICVFTRQFLRKINLSVWDPNSSSTRLDLLGYQAINMDKALWHSRFSSGSNNFVDLQFHVREGSGGWVKCQDKQTPESIMVTYASPMDCLQAIRKLNGNVDVLGAPYHFIPLSGKATSHQHEKLVQEFSTCNEAVYLGRNDLPLQILGALHTVGYVPAEMFDKSVVQFEELNKAMSSDSASPKCISCQFSFEILGISCDLCWLPAKCKCQYSFEADKELTGGPAHWIGEKFTRLVLKDAPRWSAPFSEVIRSLTINFQPARLIYESPLEFSTIHLQMYENEQYHRNILLSKNTVRNPTQDSWEQRDVYPPLGPRLKPVALDEKLYKEDLHHIEVETILNETVQLDIQNQLPTELDMDAPIPTLYLKVFKIPLDHFPRGMLPQLWTPNEFSVSQVLMRSENRADILGKVLKLECVTDSDPPVLEILLKYLGKQPEDASPSPPVHTLIPTANNVELRQLRSVAKRLVDSTSADLSTFLGRVPAKPFTQDNALTWSPVAERIVARRNIKQAVMASHVLHESQMDVISTSLAQSLTIVDGMPGTGKTTTAVLLAFIALVENPGKVMMICSSDDAADRLAEKIIGFQKDVQGVWKFMVMRVYSACVESRVAAANPPTREPEFASLHKEVRATALMVNLGRKSGITKLNRFSVGTRVEQYVSLFERYAERDLLRKVDIVITTVSTINEERFDFLANEISTVIVNGTGDIPEISLMSLFRFNPSRCVFFGDRKTQCTTVKHPGCILSGFAMNLMERAAQVNRVARISGGTQVFPYVRLEHQFRMASTILHITSALFYSNKLGSTDKIHMRKDPEYIRKITETIPKFQRSRALLVSVTGVESNRNDGFGASNINEASDLASLVTILLESQVPPKSIGIITTSVAQKREILNSISKSLPEVAKDICVKTTAASQGYENDIILYSSVHTARDLRMLDLEMYEQNLRGALTRSKFGCFILCDLALIKQIDSKVVSCFRNQMIRSERFFSIKDLVRNSS